MLAIGSGKHMAAGAIGNKKERVGFRWIEHGFNRITTDIGNGPTRQARHGIGVIIIALVDLAAEKLTDHIAVRTVNLNPVEARAFRDNNSQQQLVMLSGICRQEDVTTSNTIMSSQLANKAVIIENDGDIDRASKKGLIPRILEGIFNF